MLGFYFRMLAQTLQRRSGQFVKSLIPVFQLREQLFAHTTGPEALDVVFDASDRIVAIGLGTKEVAYVVRHLHQMLCTAHCLHLFVALRAVSAYL
jgi:hypothetical protein